ncbi:hypothetical protein [Varibaculum prostatecancerukia]|uniref:hypothetical protein n=1 Tax=Varibaculum prostatecancerukia TaxID=2811781 RepID=UPI001BFFE5A9|nr:hypothetical protein [Varibaculum prostatecancerukia]
MSLGGLRRAHRRITPGATREPSPFCCPACRSGALRSFTSSEDLPAARRSVCYTVVGHHRFPSTLGVIPFLAARVMSLES